MTPVLVIRWILAAALSALLTRLLIRGPSGQAHSMLSEARASIKSNPLAVGSIFVLFLLITAAVFAPLLAPFPPDRILDAMASSGLRPSLQHPFGTDDVSRDVFSRTIYGTRVSLSIAVLSMLVTIVAGTAYGTLAALAGGAVDSFLMRVVDALLAIPRILLLIAVVALIGKLSTPALVLLIGATGWFGVSRIVRTQVLSLKAEEFVVAAGALGAGSSRMMFSHMLPNLASPIIVAATLNLGHVIVIEAGLSFLGLGVPSHEASWGNIISSSQHYMHLWWISLFPGLAIVAAVMSLNAIGDGLRDALDPRQLLGGPGRADPPRT